MGIDDVDISVVLPCLNEEKTIANCIRKAKTVFVQENVVGEVIVSDSSTDRSPIIAEKLGAKVVHPEEMGYGNAYLKGFSEARGKIMVMADADGTYDLSELSKFINIMKNGEADVVIGSRLRGRIFPKAMSRLHRYIGNPLLTLIANMLWGSRFSDVHCGMRSLTKRAWGKLELVSGGMEFASEMIVKAVENRLKIMEVPISYHPRVGSPPKLNSLRDGLRHLLLLLLLKIRSIINSGGLK